MCSWLVLKAQISGRQGITFPPPLSLPGRRTAVTARNDLCLLIDTWCLLDSHLVTGDSRQLCHLCCWPSNDNSFFSFSFQLYLWTSEVNAVGGCGWLLGTLLHFDLDPNESLFQRVSERRARRQTRYWNFYSCHRVSQFSFWNHLHSLVLWCEQCITSSFFSLFISMNKFRWTLMSLQFICKDIPSRGSLFISVERRLTFPHFRLSAEVSLLKPAHTTGCFTVPS